MKKSIRIAFLSLFLPILCLGHGDKVLHYKDFCGVFNGYGDEVFQKLSYDISSGIDEELPALFREKIGSIPGNHRILGHEWALNDAIPQKTLDYLSKTYPGREKDIIEVWRQFAKKITQETISTTGLPAKQAKAFASLLYDIHLLGDVEPDNKLIDLVLSPRSIVRNINKDAQILFRQQPKYAKLIQRRLSIVMRQMQGKNSQLTAQALMDELHRLRMGDMLKNTWDKSLKTQYSIDRAIAANERLAQRTLQRIPGVTSEPTLSSRATLKRTDFYRRSADGKMLHAGLLTNDGRLLIAVKEGVKTGLWIVAIEGGIATYQYCNGDILKPEFKEKMIEASIKGGTVGGSVGVSILLGASPGGPVVFAVGTGAYILTEVGIALWKEHQAKKYLTIADLEAFGIKLDTTLELPYEDILTHDTTLELPKDTTLELEEDTTLSLF